MYFCLDMKDDFPKTNNITPIHKILYEQIHSFHAYTLLWKKNTANILRYYNGFQKENIGKKKMNEFETDSHLEQSEMKLIIKPKLNLGRKEDPKFPKKIKYFYTIQLNKTLKYN